MTSQNETATPYVLVVDDDDDIRGLIREVLEERGMTVLEACNGKDAMRFIRDFRLKLVILDLVMPELEGLEMIRYLRARRLDLGIIAISGAAGGLYLRPGGYLGADLVMKKPFAPEFLADRVQELMGADDK